MFHVEHMIVRLFFTFILATTLISCTRANPDAYKSDPILQDYQSQLGATASLLEAVNKQIDSTKKEMRESVPQSGQLVNHQRKLNDLL